MYWILPGEITLLIMEENLSILCIGFVVEINGDQFILIIDFQFFVLDSALNDVVFYDKRGRATFNSLYWIQWKPEF